MEEKSNLPTKGKKAENLSEKNTVLIVESYITEARVFANILKKDGFTADTAQTCKEAIEKTDRTGYTLVIIDGEVQMLV